MCIPKSFEAMKFNLNTKIWIEFYQMEWKLAENSLKLYHPLGSILSLKICKLTLHFRRDHRQLNTVFNKISSPFISRNMRKSLFSSKKYTISFILHYFRESRLARFVVILGFVYFPQTDQLVDQFVLLIIFGGIISNISQFLL